MMVGRGGGTPAADGGLARHIPVLGGRAVELLNPCDGGVYIDATFGAGGYSRAILAAAPCSVIGIDRDHHAVALAADLVQEAAGRLVVTEDRFSNLEGVARACGYDAVDGVVFDLGVSSMQLDEGARGFSFRRDGPLDMRMGGSGPSAADVVRHAPERDLAPIIGALGEERHARAVARAIVRARAEAPIETTGALAEIVGRVVHARPGAIHPATRTFQALRIFVNEELSELVAALHAAERILSPGGRLVVVSFHSLEDRIVKSFLAARGKRSAGSRHAPETKQAPASLRILTGRAVTAEETEILANPRARSAKLRAAERTEAPIGKDITASLLPRLPSLAEIVEGRRTA
jgi:16S rRNA (cytosine1402-N4)-methyltransferase